MSQLADRLTKLFKHEISHRLYNESLPRIGICLDKLTDEQIWWRPNEASNSVGNLVLHLEGNVRQWVLSGIAGLPDVRTRDAEFQAQSGAGRDELWTRISEAMEEIRPVIEGVESEQLIETRSVQIYEESVLSILVHITEHFSYHTGQIAWITKMLTEDQVGFYADQDLG